jgi:hypothetical protein
VVDEQARAELTTDLDELFREGARRMLAAALEAEVEAYITVWVPVIGVTSCDLRVLVDQPTESISSYDASRW